MNGHPLLADVLHECFACHATWEESKTGSGIVQATCPACGSHRVNAYDGGYER